MSSRLRILSLATLLLAAGTTGCKEAKEKAAQGAGASGPAAATPAQDSGTIINDTAPARPGAPPGPQTELDRGSAKTGDPSEQTH